MTDEERRRRGWRRFTDDGPWFPPEQPWEAGLRELNARNEFYRWHSPFWRSRY